MGERLRRFVGALGLAGVLSGEVVPEGTAEAYPPYPRGVEQQESLYEFQSPVSLEQTAFGKHFIKHAGDYGFTPDAAKRELARMATLAYHHILENKFRNHTIRDDGTMDYAKGQKALDAYLLKSQKHPDFIRLRNEAKQVYNTEGTNFKYPTILGVAAIESDFDSKQSTRARSGQSAHGSMQVQARHAENGPDENDLKDITANFFVGSAELDEHMRDYGPFFGYIAYNMGPAKMRTKVLEAGLMDFRFISRTSSETDESGRQKKYRLPDPNGPRPSPVMYFNYYHQKDLQRPLERQVRDPMAYWYPLMASFFEAQFSDAKIAERERNTPPATSPSGRKR